MKDFTRREFIKVAGATGAALTLAPGLPIFAEDLKTKVFPKGTKIQFSSQGYGDTVNYQDLLEQLAKEFKKESNIEVEIQIVPWGNAMNHWLLTSQGGTAADCADMFWLYSFAALGGGKNGPRSLAQYKDVLWPDLEERFIMGALRDGIWRDDFYGIVWRGDIRPQLYRTDFLEEAGFSKPPDNWEEITEYAKALTIRKGKEVTRWGFALSNAVPMQQFFQWYWQAGGEFMTADGKTATVDTPEMRETLQWIYDLIWTHQVTSPELMEKNYEPWELFLADRVAMIGSASNNQGNILEQDFPEMDGLWMMAIPPKGPKNRASYFGAGYYGALHNSDKVEESARWIEFLTRDENMQRVIEFTGYVTPNKKVMASDYWTDRPWKKVLSETMQYAHPSQHASPAWSKLIANEPGAVMFDMFYSVLVKKESMEDAIKLAQKRAQEEMDKIQL